MSIILSNVDGKFMLTINDSPRIRKIFNYFNIRKIRVPPGSGRTEANIGGKCRNELIITNYLKVTYTYDIQKLQTKIKY